MAGRSCRPRHPERSEPESGCESRPREGEDMERIERVACCGLGIMGGPMAANLARAGFELSVWTRTSEKAERFASEHDARSGATPAEAAAGADAVITMVPDSPEVESTLFGTDGAAPAPAGGALAIDMSTIAPRAAQ